MCLFEKLPNSILYVDHLRGKMGFLYFQITILNIKGEIELDQPGMTAEMRERCSGLRLRFGVQGGLEGVVDCG